MDCSYFLPCLISFWQCPASFPHLCNELEYKVIITDRNKNSFVPLLPPPSGPEPPVYWSVCFGGQFFSASVFKRHVLCVDWLVPGARTGEIASLSTIPTNPVPPLTFWGPAEHKTPPPWDDACIWRLIGGRVFALYPSPGSHLFSARAR